MTQPPSDRQYQISLDEVIAQIRDLPTLPAVAGEMLSNLDDDDLSLDKIAEKVSMDQSLAAKTLRLANSSYFGSNSKVVTLQQAVAMLGVKNVKNLIRMTILTTSFPVSRCQGFNFKAFWQQSIATAVCAELISRTLHMKHDFAFTAGLLHAIGRLVLVTRFPDQYQEVLDYRRQHDCHLLQAERIVLGVDHVQAGLALAVQWNFSEAIQDAIRGYTEPGMGGLNPVAAIVHIADAIVHALDLAKLEDDLMPIVAETAWNTLALGEMDYHAIFRETEMRFDALNQIVL
ncbi:HDOD domain-containing protein [Undibacterium sp.]|jgi:HD-like signal output (HDOD) protein|uniref:HDOD domain-containing protein n=1 Tax=Undibacterium sp. TaxID=1914977 RepID=UPI002BECB065|nr:HDOD domain-containing protein [Undibacterium sp.]HTD05362.1 HDOD domain-containing protein [Undibacterium sp.]